MDRRPAQEVSRRAAPSMPPTSAALRLELVRGAHPPPSSWLHCRPTTFPVLLHLLVPGSPQFVESLPSQLALALRRRPGQWRRHSYGGATVEGNCSYLLPFSHRDSTFAIWRCCKTFSQRECSFHWKLRCHWLKGLRQLHITVVMQGHGLLVYLYFKGVPLPKVTLSAEIPQPRVYVWPVFSSQGFNLLLKTITIGYVLPKEEKV